MKYGTKLRDLSIVGLTDIVNSALSAVFWFYLASLINPNEYGRLSYYLSIGNIASTIALFGAPNMLVVYTAKRIPIRATINFMATVTGITSAIIVYIIYNDIGISLIVIGNIIFNLINSDILAKRSFSRYMKYSITQKVLWVGVSLVFLKLIGESSIILGMASSFFIYIKEFLYGIRETKIDFKILKDKIKFLRENYIQTLVSTASSSIDRVIIVPIFGYAVLGNYALGWQFFNLLLLLPSIVSKYLLPHDSSGIPNKKLRMMTIIIAITISIIGWLVGPLVVSKLFPKFSAINELIKIFSLALVPSVISLLNYTKFLGTENTKKVLINSLIWTGVYISGIIPLGKIFGPIGFAYALVIAAISSCIYTTLADRYSK